MKKTICIIMAATMLCGIVTGCGKTKTSIKDITPTNSPSTENSQVSNSNSEDGAIALDNGFFVNSAYDKEKMITISGSEIITKDEFSYCDKTLGFGFAYVNTFKKVRGESEKLGGACTPPYSMMLSYRTDEAKKIQDNCTDEEYDAMTDNEREDFLQKLRDQTLYIAGIFRFPDNEEEQAKPQFDFFSSRFEKVDELLSYDGITYYFGYNEDYSKLTLSEQEQVDVPALVNDLESFKQTITIYPPIAREEEAPLQGDLMEFNADTLAGNKITQDILNDYDVTMVNIWSTTCGPCIEEMPQLQKLYESLPENVNLLSICTDGADDIELAKEIINDAGGQFNVLLPDDKMQASLIDNISCVPTTIFVNNEGIMIAKPILGVPDPETASDYYLENINEILNRGE